jgi:ferredoxin
MDHPGGDCLILGKHAKFMIEHELLRPVSKEEALKTLKDAEKHGFVHTTFHDLEDPEYNEVSICSCCKCCCGILELYHRGLAPINTLSSYLAKVNEDNCIGCGTCVEKCPMEAINLEDAIAAVNDDKCIGCGICAHNCPEEAMKLNRTSLRKVSVPPPKIVDGTI